MSNVPKLKKRAGEFEQKTQFDKALAVYLQILEEVAGSEDEADVALFNRVGDLMLRQGNVAQLPLRGGIDQVHVPPHERRKGRFAPLQRDLG